MNLEDVSSKFKALNRILKDLRPAAQMSFFAVTGITLIALFSLLAEDRIKANERKRLLEAFHDVIPEGRDDRLDPSNAIELPNHRGILYPLHEAGTRGSAFVIATAPNGYNGSIRYAMGIRPDGTISGVRVLEHRETPGLGDWIEATRSPWILSFVGKSLQNPGPDGWSVRKDGGIFDQFTGATITPRALVGDIRKTLESIEASGHIAGQN